VLALVTNRSPTHAAPAVGRAGKRCARTRRLRALGITDQHQAHAFAIGAMFAGFAGSFSPKQRFISPESFVFIESAIILAIVVLGGMGARSGVLARC